MLKWLSDWSSWVFVWKRRTGVLHSSLRATWPVCRRPPRRTPRRRSLDPTRKGRDERKLHIHWNCAKFHWEFRIFERLSQNRTIFTAFDKFYNRYEIMKKLSLLFSYFYQHFRNIIAKLAHFLKHKIEISCQFVIFTHFAKNWPVEFPGVGHDHFDDRLCLRHVRGTSHLKIIH